MAHIVQQSQVEQCRPHELVASLVAVGHGGTVGEAALTEDGMGDVVARQGFLEGLVAAGLTTADVMDEGHVEHDDGQISTTGREAGGRLLSLLLILLTVSIREVGLGGVETERLGVCHEAAGTTQATLKGIALTGIVGVVVVGGWRVILLKEGGVQTGMGTSFGIAGFGDALSKGHQAQAGHTSRR